MNEQEDNVLDFFPKESKKATPQKRSLPDGLLKSKPSSLLKVGLVSRVHGIKGEVFVRPLNEEFHWPKPLKQIFLNGRPFVVESCLPHKNGLRVLLQGIHDRNQARTLVGRAVSISKSLFQANEGEFYLFELQDFAVHTSGQGHIGEIKRFSSHKGQDILLVQTKNNEISIPFVEDYIESIDFQKKLLSLNLPEGFPGISD